MKSGDRKPHAFVLSSVFTVFFLGIIECTMDDVSLVG